MNTKVKSRLSEPTHSPGVIFRSGATDRITSRKAFLSVPEALVTGSDSTASSSPASVSPITVAFAIAMLRCQPSNICRLLDLQPALRPASTREMRRPPGWVWLR